MRGLVACVAVLAFYGAFYRVVVRRSGSLVQPLLRRAGLEANHPLRDVQAVGKLGMAGVSQLGFAAVLIWALDIPIGQALSRGARPELLLLGAGLGVAEIALASLLCTTIASIAATRSSPGTWTVGGGGGWMGQFGATLRVAPAWVSAILIGLYVSVEEVVFRAILLDALAPWGRAAAIAVSLVLFVIVQRFSMPTWGSALFPMIGASVVGFVHAVLYWSFKAILPLVLAHLTFFWGALSLSRSAPGSGMATWRSRDA